MTILDALILGVVQGLTEFLPISSSGHLVVFDNLLGASPEGGVLFEVVVHVGTLVAVVAVYGRDLANIIRDVFKAIPLLLRGRVDQAWSMPHVRLGAVIVLGTIPTVIIGLTLKDTFEALFDSLLAVGVALLVTGTMLWLSGRLTRGADEPYPPEHPDYENSRRVGWWQSLVIGVAQGAAITPGISRSGSTIAAALLLGIDREHAARFSFLLSIPAILGALVLHVKDGIPTVQSGFAPYALGFAAAAVTGWGALRVLLHLVRHGRFSAFAYYLWPLGIGVVTWALLRG